MNPDDIIQKVKVLGIESISRTTLLRWEKNELIPESLKGNLGRGKGRFSDYPEGTAEEFYASYKLLHAEKARYSISAVANARKYAKEALTGNKGTPEELAKDAVRSLLRGDSPLWYDWLCYWQEAYGCDSNGDYPNRFFNECVVCYTVTLTDTLNKL